jgi:hypothetical protein
MFGVLVGKSEIKGNFAYQYIVAHQLKIVPLFMECYCSLPLPYLQAPATIDCPEPDESKSSAHPPSLFS